MPELEPTLDLGEGAGAADELERGAATGVEVVVTRVVETEVVDGAGSGTTVRLSVPAHITGCIFCGIVFSAHGCSELLTASFSIPGRPDDLAFAIHSSGGVAIALVVETSVRKPVVVTTGRTDAGQQRGGRKSKDSTLHFAGLTGAVRIKDVVNECK